MTPNIGQGANTAIEDAAVLASLINRLVNVDGVCQPSVACMDKLLQEYKSIRYERVRSTCERAKFGARFHTRDSWLKGLVGRYVYPHVSSLIETRACKILAGGNVIDFLPMPDRSVGGHPTGVPKVTKPSQRPWALLWISSLVIFFFFSPMRSYLFSAFW